MTVVNQFDDNETLWAGDLNAIVNALGAGGIISGCSISKGTGDWDIDVTSGQIIESNTEASISSGTVTITDSSGLSSGQSRVTLIHADTGDALASTDGTAASNPATPDIPSGEVLLGFVVVADSDSTVADSDIFDIPALIQADGAQYAPDGSNKIGSLSVPYGDETDGSITRSSNLNENGVLVCTDYTLEAGVTATVTNGVLVIIATDSISISGTIDANETGASGGAGKSNTAGGGDGAPGANGDYTGAGGSGGDTQDHSGGAGGTRRIGDEGAFRFWPSPVFEVALSLEALAGSGGGGGATDSDSATGGDGGDGGGCVLLVAPDITIDGTITADGQDGQDGTTSSAGAGGGGGGSGGLIVAIGDTVTDGSATTSVAGGAGGSGAAGSSTAQAGSPGDAGSYVKVEV